MAEKHGFIVWQLWSNILVLTWYETAVEEHCSHEVLVQLDEERASSVVQDETPTQDLGQYLEHSANGDAD